MYVCMYICVYICMYVCMHLCKFVQEYRWMDVKLSPEFLQITFTEAVSYVVLQGFPTKIQPINLSIYLINQHSHGDRQKLKNDVFNLQFLAIQCPEQKNTCSEYKPCGTACPKTCRNICDVTPTTCPVTCVEGCFCPNGTVMHDGKCVEHSRCPCYVNGTELATGSMVIKNCQIWYSPSISHVIQDMCACYYSHNFYCLIS